MAVNAKMTDAQENVLIADGYLRTNAAPGLSAHYAMRALRAEDCTTEDRVHCGNIFLSLGHLWRAKEVLALALQDEPTNEFARKNLQRAKKAIEDVKDLEGKEFATRLRTLVHACKEQRNDPRMMYLYQRLESVPEQDYATQKLIGAPLCCAQADANGDNIKLLEGLEFECAQTYPDFRHILDIFEELSRTECREFLEKAKGAVMKVSVCLEDVRKNAEKHLFRCSDVPACSRGYPQVLIDALLLHATQLALLAKLLHRRDNNEKPKVTLKYLMGTHAAAVVGDTLFLVLTSSNQPALCSSTSKHAFKFKWLFWFYEELDYLKSVKYHLGEGMPKWQKEMKMPKGVAWTYYNEMGYGLVATENIAKGKLVLQYEGELGPEPKDTSYCADVCRCGPWQENVKKRKKMFVDAKSPKRRGLAAMINDAGPLAPNFTDETAPLPYAAADKSNMRLVRTHDYEGKSRHKRRAGSKNEGVFYKTVKVKRGTTLKQLHAASELSLKDFLDLNCHLRNIANHDEPLRDFEVILPMPCPCGNGLGRPCVKAMNTKDLKSGDDLWLTYFKSAKKVRGC